MTTVGTTSDNPREVEFKVTTRTGTAASACLVLEQLVIQLPKLNYYYSTKSMLATRTYLMFRRKYFLVTVVDII